jgi:hypothetical protein
VLPRALWSGGSGFAAQPGGLRARPRSGAIGGALVMPRKSWPGPLLPPPKFPGVAMDGILPTKRQKGKGKAKTGRGGEGEGGGWLITGGCCDCDITRCAPCWQLLVIGLLGHRAVPVRPGARFAEPMPIYQCQYRIANANANTQHASRCVSSFF